MKYRNSLGKLNWFCIDCGKELSRAGGERCRECYGKHLSVSQVGENNPNFVHGKTNKSKCLDCGSRITGASAVRCVPCGYKHNGVKQRGIGNPMFKDGRHANNMEANCIDCGQVIWSSNTRCKTCWHLYNVGENNSAWRGGVSFAPYVIGWGRRLRESIRRRDGYTCQECGVKQDDLPVKLCVHHIDYDKTNIGPENLVSLCQSCHGKISHRPEWAEVNYRRLLCAVRL